MKEKCSIVILLSLVSAFSYHCGKNINEPDSAQDKSILKEMVSGYIQKGPYINGSSITLYELDDSYAATGKVYDSQITDNTGSFEIKNLNLKSPYVKLKADGFYFNEIEGKNSNAQLTLHAFADLSVTDSINVNVLSHLEKNRVEYLVSEGETFSEAKRQAQREILAIFEIGKSNISNFETLDISKGGDENAILLAVSVILQGYRTVAELSELLANISNDIKEDGRLNDENTGSALINDAVLLDLNSIRKNLEDRYRSLGINTTIPNFESYVDLFIDNTDYKLTKKLEYPSSTDYGVNILDTLRTSFISGNNNYYGFAANLPKGASLKIVMEYSSGPHSILPDSLQAGHWYYVVLPDAPKGWEISKYDFANHSQIFTASALESEKRCDLKLYFTFTSGQNKYKIKYYENNGSEPTRVKVITVD